jgi:integrase
MARKRKSRRTPGTGIIRPLQGGRAKASYPKPGGGYWTKNCHSVAEAEAWLASFEQRKEQKLELAGGQMVLRDWIDVWVNARPAHLKPTTKADYAYKLGQLSAIAETPLAELMPDMIDAALLALEREGIAHTTIKQVRGLLVRALREAVRRRYIAFNPAEAERTSRPPSKERTRLNAGQAHILCATASGFYAAAWPLLICCGFRAGELCGLRLTDVDLETCVIHVRQVVSDLRGETIVQDTPKTPASRRSVPFPRAHVRALQAHLDALEKRATLALRRGTWQEHGLLFPGKSGRPLNPTALRHALHDATDAAKLPPVTTHELRHTCAGFLEDLHTPEHIIAGILGHGPKNITRHYAPPPVENMRPWIEQVWTLVFAEEARQQKHG